MFDQLHRFLFESLSVRGALVRLDTALARNLSAHAYPAPIQRLLAEATTSVALLGTTVKIKGRISLQFQGESPVRLLLAECTDDLGVRSIAQFGEGVVEADFGALLGNGMLALSLLPEDGQSYQGVVPLDGKSLAQCVEHYFQQSEQLATRFFLFIDDARAVGLMIQALPGLSQSEDFHRIVTLAETLTKDEAFTLPVETLLHRLYHEEEVRLFAPSPVRFQCRCSKERCENTLRTLGETELLEMAEKEGGASIHCDFCNEHYRFDAKTLTALAAELHKQWN